MVANLIVILASFMVGIAQNWYQADTNPQAYCNYVVIETQTETDPFALPAFAIDVCSPFAVNGVIGSRKYVCTPDKANVVEQIYTDSECNGSPSINNVSIAMTGSGNNTFSYLSCENIGICEYFMMQTPCYANNTYDTYPFVARKCISGDASISWGPTVYAYHFECDGDIVGDQCCTDCSAPIPQLATKSGWVGDGSQCIDNTYSPISGCMSITSEPTMEPTLDPTTDPTTNPTGPTMEPTIEPTENTYEPTQNPTMDPTASPVNEDINPDNASFINLITNYIFVIFLVCYIYFV